MGSHDTIQLTSKNFDDQVLNAEGPVLVDFYADWCPPCRALGPTIDELADDYAGRATVGKVNVDESPDLASRYGIRSIPTVLLFIDGRVAQKLVGVTPKQAFEDALDESAMGACN